MYKRSRKRISKYQISKKYEKKYLTRNKRFDKIKKLTRKSKKRVSKTDP